MGVFLIFEGFSRPGEDDQDLPQASGSCWHWGGCWNMSDIVGVRYTTMFGDPGREFLQSATSSKAFRGVFHRFSCEIEAFQGVFEPF